MAGRPPVIMLGAALLGLVIGADLALAQWHLPAGFSSSYEMQLKYGTRGFEEDEEDERIWENWLDVDYVRGDILAGVRFVAFEPPDPVVSQTGESSHGIDLWYGEYGQSWVSARAGHFYSLFGRGLTLRIYEDRILRVDTNARGGKGTFYLNDGELTLLGGRTAEGDAVNADRTWREPLYAADFEHGVWDAASLRLGASYANLDLEGSTRAESAPLRMKGARTSATVGPVDLAAEFARVDGPNNAAIDAERVGFTGPNFHGRGFYGVASTVIGPVGIVFDYKDYHALFFRNNAKIDYILPPAVLRDHTFSLLNRHPHPLDTGDEKGHQLEVSGVSHWADDKSETLGITSLLVNWTRTRNHDPDDFSNHFDDAYVEIQQEIGESSAIIGALSWQRSFADPTTPDPLRTLWTPIADVRHRLTDVYALHVQFEHQHDSSDYFGEFDTQFLVLELTRSPSLTLGFLGEWSNKSELQLERLNEEKTSFYGGSIDYLLFGQHQLRLFYGTRNAGFICVGGVCRFEPAFDGLEFSLVSRF